MEPIRWVFALVICFVAVAVVDASGVTIETIKEGDGVNFPQAGGKISVMSVLCPFCRLAEAYATFENAGRAYFFDSIRHQTGRGTGAASLQR